MKIAFLSNAKSIHIVRWANAMYSLGHEICVISCCNHVPEKEIGYAEGIDIISLKFSAPLGYYLNAHQVKSVIKYLHFDIVNIHYASGYGTLGRRAGLRDALLNVWGSDVYDFPYQSLYNMQTIKKNLKYYNYLASTSYCMAEQTRKLVNKEDISIIPFGVDMEKFKPICGLKNDNIFLIGTVKTLSPKYGIADTIQGFILLCNRLVKEGMVSLAEKLRYEIYGEGELKATLQRLIDNNQMQNKIKLCGYVENGKLPKIINSFEIFCSNSISESFGVAAVEAMACGVPVITSDADGFVEVVDNGVTGFVVPKGDVVAISQKLYQLLFDADLRGKMGKSGVARVAERYSWSNNVFSMEKIYEHILISKQNWTGKI